MVPETGPVCQSRRSSLLVTEVFRPGKSFRPAPLRPVDAPGTRHPARSSSTTRSSKIVGRVHGLLVHFEDYVAAIQSEVFGERSLLHVLHDDALARRNVEAVGEIGW